MMLAIDKVLNDNLKKNMKQAKKSEIGRRFFDFKTRIYKMMPLKDLAFKALVAEETLSGKNLLSKEEIRQIFKTSLRGMSGDGQLVEQKLAALETKEEKTLVINAVECEPGLVHDEWLTDNRRELIERGIESLKTIFDFKKILFVTRHQVEISGATVVVETYEFPLGEEHVLLRRVMGLNVPSNEYPAQHGVLVLNLQTVVMAGLLASNVTPQGRYLTVADTFAGTATVVYAPYGMKLVDIYQAVYPDADLSKLFAGGGMLRCDKAADGAQLVPETCFIGVGEAVNFESAARCCYCGKCQRKCPQKLHIRGLVKGSLKGKKLRNGEMSTCLKCGACVYFCPKKIAVGSVLHSMVENNQ